jgi:S-adenosylmethionine:tRNA ribosyltransferase-isomerase
VIPARLPRERGDKVRLLAVDSRAGRHIDARVADLPALLAPGDVLVVNDAATLPGSLRARAPSGAAIELRLTGGAPGGGPWRAVVFGAGSWRQPTESRPPPEPLVAGDRLRIDGGLVAEVSAVSRISPRLVDLRFDRSGAALWQALYAAGKPVQYSYLGEELPLWSVQTAYGGRPWAAEMPSAGRPLSWTTLLALRRRGVGLTWITHAAGLSSTGDPALDAALPFPERFDIPVAAVRAIGAARRGGGRVIAVGTSAVRALEGAAALAGGELRAGTGETGLIIDADHRLRVVDGLLTGVHDPQDSHYRLLAAFAGRALLAGAWRRAMELGYCGHEFGDLVLVVPAVTPAATSPSGRGLPRAPPPPPESGGHCPAAPRSGPRPEGLAHRSRSAPG